MQTDWLNLVNNGKAILSINMPYWTNFIIYLYWWGTLQYMTKQKYNLNALGIE